jgi:hypothetical protein
MNFSVNCECGRAVAVSATSAGSRLACTCGRTVDVPTLSELRRNAGLNPIPLNAAESIQKLVVLGELPNEKTCPFTGRIPDSVVWLRVECESKWVRGGERLGTLWVFFYLFLFGWVGAWLIALRGETPREELGRDISVDLPVRVSSEAIPSILKTTSQRKLRKAISQNPVYSKLLTEYPSAYVTVLRQA